MVHQQAKAGVAELGAIPLQIVATELVNDNDDDEFGMGVVGRGPGVRRRESSRKQRCGEKQPYRCLSGGGFHREVSLHSEKESTKRGIRETRTADRLEAIPVALLSAFWNNLDLENARP